MVVNERISVATGITPPVPWLNPIETADMKAVLVDPPGTIELPAAAPREPLCPLLPL
jgi:hypothetical protein